MIFTYKVRKTEATLWGKFFNDVYIYDQVPIHILGASLEEPLFLSVILLSTTTQLWGPIEGHNICDPTLPGFICTKTKKFNTLLSAGGVELSMKRPLSGKSVQTECRSYVTTKLRGKLGTAGMDTTAQGTAH